MYRVGVPTVWESHVLTWNGSTPLTWSVPSKFCLGKDSRREDEEHQNLLRMAGFPSEEQMDSWWNTHNGEILFNEYEGQNVFHSTHNDANAYKEILRQHVYKTTGLSTLKTNRWYTLSFLCKGTGTLCTYFYPSSSGHVLTAAGVYIDDVFHTPAATDMVATFTLSSQWTRHKVTFKTSASFLGEVMLLFRLLAGTNKEIFITCPKLEESSMATNYNMSYGDLQSMVIGEDGFPDECGVWKDDRQYVWDDIKRQYVYYQIDGQYKAFFVRRKGMIVPVNTPPVAGGNTYWEQGSTDVSTLLANTIIGANVKIGGFLASMSVLKSQNERIEIDGQNNVIKVLNAAKTAIIAAMGDVDFPFFAGGTSGAGAKFHVDAAGKMYGEDADIKGKVEATSGKIGGFTITDKLFKCDGNNPMSLNSETGEVSMADGAFSIDAQKNITLKGQLQALRGLAVSYHLMTGGYYYGGVISSWATFIYVNWTITSGITGTLTLPSDTYLIDGRILIILNNAADGQGFELWPNNQQSIIWKRTTYTRSSGSLPVIPLNGAAMLIYNSSTNKWYMTMIS
jgi:hypothetical protein